MSGLHQTSLTFASVSSRVLMRVIARRWLALLGRSGWWAGGALLAVALLIWFAVGARGMWMVPVLALGWSVGCLALVWLKRPGAYPALALWDRETKRPDAFANAWWFEQQPAKTTAQQQHIDAQLALLPDALPLLARDLPLRAERSVWAAPILAALALLIPAVAGTSVTREILSADQGRTAADEAKKIAAADPARKNFEALTEQEKKEVEKLKDQLQKTADDLAQSAGKDAREVLASLEQRARDAEKLADKLATKDQWASDEMIAGLRAHADTADLGDAVAEKNAANTAKAADALASTLNAPQLDTAMRDRVKETLKAVQKQSEKEDRARTVGENVLAASDRMAETQPAAAANEFQKLADKMREIARREQTQKELEKLAQQLRDAGGNIAGQSTEGMQQMSAAGQQSQQGEAAQQVPQSSGQQPPQALTPPGLNQQQGQQQQRMNSSPSSGQGQQMQMMSQNQGKKGDGDKPQLFAPVPGSKSDKNPDTILLGQDKPENGEPKASIQMASPGGKQAGAGKAELNAEATEKSKASGQSMVSASATNEGQSSVRAIEGGVKKETTARTATQTAVDFIHQQEQALDESALPPSRREQVRRYFTELRKRFEKTAP